MSDRPEHEALIQEAETQLKETGCLDLCVYTQLMEVGIDPNSISEGEK